MHVWYVQQETIVDSGVLEACLALLSPDERERHIRYRFEVGRHEYLITHALARSCLSHYADVAPGDWSFDKNQYGPSLLRSSSSSGS